VELVAKLVVEEYYELKTLVGLVETDVEQG
jgi:hypothetical protein